MRFVIIALFVVCFFIFVGETFASGLHAVSQGSKNTVGKLNNLDENVKQILANSGKFV